MKFITILLWGGLLSIYMARCKFAEDGLCQVLVYSDTTKPFPCDGRQSCMGKGDELQDIRFLKTTPDLISTHNNSKLEEMKL